MMIHISMDLYPEATDPDHETGVTEQTFDLLMDFLMQFGSEIDIRRDTP